MLNIYPLQIGKGAATSFKSFSRLRAASVIRPTQPQQPLGFRIRFRNVSCPARTTSPSSRGFAYYLIPAALAFSIYAANIIANPDFGLFPAARKPLKQVPLPTDPATSTMSPPSTAPGRPETLTKEEEVKLKELWNAALKIFGVSAPAANPSGVPTASDDERGETSGSPDDKKKKGSSLGRLLTRKDKAGPAKKEAAEGVVLDASDDKYGQNQEYKAALATHTPAELREAFWGLVKCDNPDGLLLRFLRARKWDVDKALVMVVSTMNWRSKEMKVCFTNSPKTPARSKRLLMELRTGTSAY